MFALLIKEMSEVDDVNKLKISVDKHINLYEY
jgi:hypothetical protein